MIKEPALAGVYHSAVVGVGLPEVSNTIARWLALGCLDLLGPTNHLGVNHHGLEGLDLLQRYLLRELRGENTHGYVGIVP